MRRLFIEFNRLSSVPRLCLGRLRFLLIRRVPDLLEAVLSALIIDTLFLVHLQERLQSGRPDDFEFMLYFLRPLETDGWRHLRKLHVLPSHLVEVVLLLHRKRLVLVFVGLPFL